MILTILQMTQMMTMVMMTRNNQEELALIITAAGSSTRMGGIKKEYLSLNGGTVLSSAAKVFLNTLNFSCVAVTYPAQESEEKQLIAEEQSKTALFSDPQTAEHQNSSTKFIFLPGGKSRQASVYNALLELKKNFPKTNPIVFIHDGARPFVTERIILDTLAAAKEYGASVPGLQPVDTQNEIDDNGFISRHLVRSSLTAVQTPQVFHLNELIKAHEEALKTQKEYTDDTEIWDLFSGMSPVKVVAGDSINKKITYKEDIEIKQENKMIRTGIGYDKHRLVEGRPLMLGGLKIESDLGEDGHSDGDVLLHAITDALLGASGSGDIGSYFPPEDMQWKDADSKRLLKKCWDDVRAQGWKLSNLDCVIALEKPKFLPHRNEVIKSIAEVLEVLPEQIFVKAKTGEKLGDVGERRAVEVWATCLLEK